MTVTYNSYLELILNYLLPECLSPSLVVVKDVNNNENGCSSRVDAYAGVRLHWTKSLFIILFYYCLFKITVL